MVGGSRFIGDMVNTKSDFRLSLPILNMASYCLALLPYDRTSFIPIEFTKNRCGLNHTFPL